MSFKYPLSVDPYSLLDRLKVCAFILNKNNRLTIGPETKKFEKELEEYSGSSCVLTGSGSAAVHLLIEVFLQTHNYDPNEVTFFCPSTTWMSSVSPIFMRGCNIKFVDINLNDFSFNYDKLEKAVKECTTFIKVLWPTALIGFIPDIQRLREIRDKTENCYLFADLCETQMGQYEGKQILSCFDMAVTSFFWAHEISSLEAGNLSISKICKNHDAYFNNAQMLRSHGLSRVLEDRKEKEVFIENNPLIDPEFLFPVGGTNWRPTDLNSKFGRLDFKRVYKYEEHRKNIWNYFNNKLLDLWDYKYFSDGIIPFCLPIILEENSKKDIKKIKQDLKAAGFETRPIIACLPIQPFFQNQNIGQDEIFENSLYLNDRGLYVGLNYSTNQKTVDKLINILKS